MTKTYRSFLAGLLLPLILSVFAPLARGQIFVSLSGSSTILQFSASGGPPTTFASGSSSGLFNPQGLAFDSTGFLYTVNGGNNTIVKFPAVPTPGNSQTASVLVPASGSGLFSSFGLVFRAGFFYAASGGLGTIEKFDNSGVHVTPTFASTGAGTAPYGLTFDSTGNLYVANRNANNILMFPPGSGTPSVFASALSGLRDLAWRAGVLYVAGGGSTILEFATPTGTPRSSTFFGLNDPRGLAFDCDGNLYVTGGNNTVAKYNSAGSLLWSESTGANSPGFIAIQLSCVSCLPMINPSFELDTFTVLPGYALNGNGPITGWSSPNNSGVNPVVGVPLAAANPFSDNGTIPHGSQVAFMQHDFSMSQVVSGFTVGAQYYVQYYENSRGWNNGTVPFLEVKIGGVTIVAAHAVLPVGGTNPYHHMISSTFTATSNSLELAFIKSNPQGDDTTALIDNVCISLRPCVPAPANMVLWLPLDETTGPTSTNLAPGGLNGIQVNSPVVTSGLVANSLTFSGVNSLQKYVQVPSYDGINFGTNDFSIDAWVRRATNDPGTSLNFIVDKRASASQSGTGFIRGYSFFLQIGGQLEFHLADGNSGPALFISSPAVTVPIDGQWHHVAVTVDRDNTSGVVFYVDGAASTATNNPVPYSGSVSTLLPLRVASREPPLSGNFLGSIDEVELFNRVLAPAEIAALFNAGAAGKCKPACVPAPANMVLWLPLDEASGTNSANLVPGGNNGVQLNGPAVTSGLVANSLSFNGTSQYVEVPSYTALNFGTNDFSIDAWIRRATNDLGTSATSNYRVIVEKAEQSPVAQRGYSFYLHGSQGTLGLQLADGTFTTYTSSFAVPNDGQWRHVAVTVDRDKTNGIVFYVNGVAGTGVHNPMLSPGSISSTFPLRVGSQSSFVNSIFLGSIDEVELFNRVLAPAEIAGLFNAGSAGKCKTPCATPLVINCVTNKTVACGSNWTFDLPTAASCCSTNVTLNILSTVTNGVCPQIITRTWVATDACNNSVTCSQIVTVVDTTPPVLSCAINKKIICGTAWSFDTPTATDNCSPGIVGAPGLIPVTILSTVTNGICPMVITRTWLATDACGNTNICSQMVTFVNSNLPVMVCPKNIVVSSCTLTQLFYTTIATDDCNTNLTVTYTPPSGTSFTPGTTTTVLCVTSNCVGSVNCSFTVTVQSAGNIENGDFSVTVPANGTGGGWTSSDIVTSGGGGWGAATGNPGGGFRLNETGSLGKNPTIQQTVCCLIPGSCYTLHWQMKVHNYQSNPNNLPSFGVLLDGTPVAQYNLGTNATVWRDFSVTFVATNSCQTIGFSAEMDPTDVSYDLDNVRLEQCATNLCVPAPGNMVLWLPFDETSGITSTNLVPGGNQGTQVNGPLATTGFVANSLTFNGTNQYVEVPSYPAINFGTNDFSIDAWVRRATNDIGTTIRSIVDKRDDPGAGLGQLHGYLLYLAIGGGQLSFQLADGNSQNYVSSLTVPNDGQWHHVAVTVDRDNANGIVFYLNGVAGTGLHNPMLRPGSVSTVLPLRVGSIFVPGGGYFFSGSIDEVELFNRVLGTNEIAALYNAGSAGKCKTPCAIPLVANCAADKVVACGSNWTFDLPTATSCCSTNVTFAILNTVTNGACPQLITRTWQMTDTCANTVTCSQTVTVEDTKPPVLTCAPNKTVNCSLVGSTGGNFDAPTASDGCSGTNVTITILSTVTTTNGCSRLMTRTWQASDACNNTNTCSQTITLVDTTPPVLTCPANKTVNCNTVWTFDAPTATDSCSGTNVTLTILGTVTNGTCLRVITRTWQATDACNNSATCIQTVTVLDTTPPVLTCATNKTVLCGTAWTFDPPTATDSCSGTNVIITILNTSTNGICPVVFARTWQAADLCGNTATCTQTVTVVDTTPPVFTQAGTASGPLSFFPCAINSQTVSTYSSPLGYGYITLTLSNAVNASLWSSQFPTLFPGANRQGSQVVGGGTFTLSIDLTHYQNLSPSFVLGFYNIFATSVSGSYSMTAFNNSAVQISPPFNWNLIGNEDDTSHPASSGHLVLNTGGTFSSLPYQPGANGRGSDAAFWNQIPANTATIVITGMIPSPSQPDGIILFFAESAPPALTCDSKKTVNCGTAWTFDAPTAIDSCSGTNVTLTILSTTTNGICPMVITRTWQATDTCKNSATCSQTVTVVDTTAPVISTVPVGTNLGCNPANLPTDASVRLLVSATDNCGVPTINVSHVDISTGCSVRRTFTITASDSCLNTSAASTVLYTWTADLQPPQIDCPTNTVTVAFEGHCQILIPLFHPKAKDNCTPQSQLVYTQSPAAGVLLPGPSQLVTVMVTDACGNSNKCQITVYGKDKTAPKVDCPPSLTVTNCVVPNVLPLKASDNCTPANLLIFTQSPAAGTTIAAGGNQVTVTVRDQAGNISTCIIQLISSGPQSFLGSLFNTGVDNSKVVVASGAIDSHYTLGPVPTGSPTGVNFYNAPQARVALPIWGLPPFNLSAWIAPAANSSPFGNGFYTYTNQFTLPAGTDPATASISGKWAADNGANMYLNGILVSTIATPFGFSQWTPFTINSAFLPFPAVNRILFVVTNQNPRTALRVEIKNAIVNCSTCAPPSIVWMTPNLVRPAYSSASFTVIAGGTPPFTYQWYRNGALLSNNGHYAGVTGPTLTINPPLNSDAGTYTVVISNSCGTYAWSSKLTLTLGWPWPWGWWNFAQIGNPMAAAVGRDLILAGTNSLGITSGTTDDFGLPNSGGDIVNVMHIPALLGDTLIELPLVGPLGSNSVSSYTIIMDVFAPANFIGSINTLFDAGGPGKDGLRLVMEPSEPMGTNNRISLTGTVGGVRMTLHSTNPPPENAWNRVALVVDTGDNSVLDAAFDPNSVVSLYLNGQHAGSTMVETEAGLALDWRSNPPTVFSSRTGTSGESYVSSIQLHAFAMTPEMIAIIGSAEDGPAPADDTAIGDVGMPDELPAILQQPQSQTNVIGSRVTFSVTATGAPPLTYLWRFNNTIIPGATNANYSIFNAQANSVGIYDVVVFSSSGSVISTQARLVMGPGGPLAEAPAITRQPQGQTNVIGTDVTFSVTATGTPPLSYQWHLNGINRLDGTNSTYIIGNAQMINSGAYDVMVSNASGSVTSTSARLMMKNKFVAGANSDGTLSIAWPPNEGWILQESMSLFGPWSNSASQGGSVNIRPSGAGKFYRLLKP
jgi:hypothetical protein